MTIEGIPDGWELVRIGKPFINERYIGLTGQIINCVAIPSGEAYAIVRKIEKPKQYRSFANAAEFRPHKDQWVLRASKDWVDGVGEYRITGFDDNGVWLSPTDFVSYQQMLDEDRRFDDGTPFGIEVTE